MMWMYDVAEFLNLLEPDERVDALQELKEKSCFCWECGIDFDIPDRICHCTNDD